MHTPSEEQSRKATAAKVRAIVPKCCVCGLKPVGHYFAQFATTVISEENKPHVLALFSHVKNHEWDSLKNFTDFKGDQDDAIVYAVTGPHPGGMVVLIRDPFDLYARVEIHLEITVTAEEIQTIEGLTYEHEWQEL
jgi:hypothetical protein